jgi:hypothetical protein
VSVRETRTRNQVQAATGVHTRAVLTFLPHISLMNEFPYLYIYIYIYIYVYSSVLEIYIRIISPPAPPPSYNQQLNWYVCTIRQIYSGCCDLSFNTCHLAKEIAPHPSFFVFHFYTSGILRIEYKLPPSTCSTRLITSLPPHPRCRHLYRPIHSLTMNLFSKALHNLQSRTGHFHF